MLRALLPSGIFRVFMPLRVSKRNELIGLRYIRAQRKCVSIIYRFGLVKILFLLLVFLSAFISYEGYSTGQMELNKYKRRDFIIKIETTVCEEKLEDIEKAFNRVEVKGVTISQIM
jgi:hypothetical protein